MTMPQIVLTEEQARVVATAAPLGRGIDELRATLARLLIDDRDATPVLERHRVALEAAATALERGAASLLRGESPEIAAIDGREALGQLDVLTGASSDVALLDAIFSRFCIGK